MEICSLFVCVWSGRYLASLDTLPEPGFSLALNTPGFVYWGDERGIGKELAANRHIVCRAYGGARWRREARQPRRQPRQSPVICVTHHD